MVVYRSVTKGLGVENWMRFQNRSHPLARNEPKGVHGLDCLHPVLDGILIFSLARLPKWGFSTPIGTEFREEAFLKHFIWIERVPPFPFPGLLRFQVLYTVVGGQYSCAACSRSQS